MSETPQQYCLRWNNYQNNLTNVFDQLLQSEAFVDVTLACDGDSLKAHKMILSACSPYFQQLFFDNPCSHPIVILKDVKWDELKAVVEFMYRGEINVSQEQLAPLLKVAELLKIRGLADVSRGSTADLATATVGVGKPNSECSTSHAATVTSNSLPNSSLLVQQTSSHLRDSDNESPIPTRHNILATKMRPQTATLHHRSPLHPFHLQQQLLQSAASSNGHHFLNSLKRKRRKMSTLSDDLSLSPSDAFDDDRIDSPNGGYDTPSPMALLEAGLLGPSSSSSTPALLPSVAAGLSGGSGNNKNERGGSLPSSSSASILPSTSGLTPSSLINFHTAAVAAAAAAAANVGPSPSTSNMSSAINDMDLKPGIREMIREEERAKMLESTHGWLGPAAGGGTSASAALSDSYQYQIQSLWQKCWSTNQSGMAQALRFRERGPLKSWRPETMADAIFAVLREGLSLSQAARKFDIPYPTFVLYANRVHNMLGPSSDGSGDMRPKGRGRPQRILLGTWPEDHIHGVIRAVVFRDGAKDDLPLGFGREFLTPQPGSSHNSNGLDMSIHTPFFGLHRHRNGSGTTNNSFGSANERFRDSLSGLKSHLLNTSSRSNSPLLDGLVGSSSLPEDILREQREEEILRAMKKSGDDDDEDNLDDEDEEEIILRRKRALSNLLLSERRLNSKHAQNRIDPSKNQGKISKRNSNDSNTEVIHIKTEINYDENDLLGECEAQEEDGLFIHEEKSNMSSNSSDKLCPNKGIPPNGDGINSEEMYQAPVPSESSTLEREVSSLTKSSEVSDDNNRENITLSKESSNFSNSTNEPSTLQSDLQVEKTSSQQTTIKLVD